ncbi:site-2 protease family protein [Candidatus Nitrosotenuis cloacae]|uniref:Peptidase n=1 Tax=Candidatus Nitrosotenuis cloacae TaxID=1603555 RepID=A0A3G1B395_9ARCH|nr:site-2 protease family protein [Candidatus Nitrosotenuis cloacae]AJZ76336.1 peptidase [Candidatus Nitrosotenuis cloacae]
MSEPTQEQVISIVSSTFEVQAVNITLEKMEFEIADAEFREKFVALAQKLESIGIICFLQKSADKTIIQVNRLPPESKKKKLLSRAWIQRILFGVVVAFVMVDGYYRTLGVNSLIYIGDPLDFAILYTISLVGILGIHEAGHLVAAKMHKIRTSWPYFIPGVPVIGLPTFGAMIQSRGLLINRNIVFDVAIAGPLAGLVIAILVSFYGAYTSPILDQSIVDALPDGQLRKLDDSIFMTLALATFGKAGPDVEVLMSPVLFAAWLGFLITFLNLLPAWQLDGGHMARTIFGQKIHRIATYASVGVLFLLRYEMMAIFILIFSMRNMSVRPLDDVSPLSKNRKLLYVLVIALAVLCAPLPFSVWPK